MIEKVKKLFKKDNSKKPQIRMGIDTSVSGKISDWLFKIQFGTTPRIEFYRKLVSLIAHGMPLMRTLEKILLSYNKRGMQNSLMGKIITDVFTRLSIGGKDTGGVSLSGALKKWASPAETMLIFSGEKGGDAAQGLREAIFFTESKRKITETLVKSLIYPIVLFLALIGLYMVFSYQVLPAMIQLLPVEKWPAISKKMYHVLMFVREDLGWAAAVLAFVIVGIGSTLTRWTGKVRSVADKFPPYSTYRVINGSGFLLALSGMMKSGTSIRDALLNMRSHATPYLRSKIDLSIENLAKGQTPGEALDTGLFDNETAVSLDIFGDSSSFSESIELIGKESVDETIKGLQKLGKALTTVALVCIGFGIGFFLNGFYTLLNVIRSTAGA